MGAEMPVNTLAAGKRTAKRARVLLAARLRTAAGEFDAKLRDLSPKGALLECTEPLAADTEVVFVRGGTIVPARVAWAAGGRVGLEFVRTINQTEVLVQLGRGLGAKPKAAPTAAERCRRPRILGTDMTEREKSLARQWAVQVGISVTSR